MSLFESELNPPSWAPLDPAVQDSAGEERGEKESTASDEISIEPRRQERNRLEFLSIPGTCPSCGHGLVRLDGHCRLCETDIRKMLLDSVHLVDLSMYAEEDQPRKLLRAVDRTRARRIPLIRVVHGAGQGSTLRTLCWYLMDRGDIRNWVIGEVLGQSVPVGREFMEKHPVIRWASDWNASNDAVTWIEVG